MSEQDSVDYNFSSVEKEVRVSSYLLGAIGAVLGALIGAIPWAIAYFFGWFVGWLGFLIGVCAARGYNILRGKNGWPAVFIIIFATIFGVAVGQVLGDFFAIGKYIANSEIEWATYSEIPKIYFYALRADSGMIGSVLGSFGLGLVFAGLGVWRLIRDMALALKTGEEDDMNQGQAPVYPEPEQVGEEIY